MLPVQLRYVTNHMISRDNLQRARLFPVPAGESLCKSQLLHEAPKNGGSYVNRFSL